MEADKQLRQITENELKNIIQNHKEWLARSWNEEKGAKADFSSMDLVERDFSKAYLQKSIYPGSDLRKAKFIGTALENADFSECDLTDADFTGASISGANFTRANLTRAKFSQVYLGGSLFIESTMNDVVVAGCGFSHADFKGTNLFNLDLHDCDFSNCRNLIASQFAGANISGAKLPEHLKGFDESALKHCEKLASYARKLFTIILLACAYSLLIVGTTTDVSLLTDTQSFSLPILGTNISLVFLYVISPVFLLGMYTYFQLYLQRLWDTVGTLPAFFSDGKPLHRKIDPWLVITAYIRARFKLLSKNGLPFYRLQLVVSVFLLWCAVPLTVILLWLRFLTRHDWFNSLIIILALNSILVVGISFFSIAQKTLSGKSVKSSANKKWAILLTGTTSLGILLMLTYCAFDQVKPVSSFFRVWGYTFRADFNEQIVSRVPTDWIGSESQYPLVKGAQLRGRDLRYSEGLRANLINADLRKADLSHSKLLSANLSGARLDSSKLESTQLIGSKMAGVSLIGCKLDSANFEGVNLKGAVLEGTSLKWAVFRGADLSSVTFAGADLRNANFHGASIYSLNILGADLRGATGIKKSDFGQLRIQFNSETKLPEDTTGN